MVCQVCIDLSLFRVYLAKNDDNNKSDASLLSVALSIAQGWCFACLQLCLLFFSTNCANSGLYRFCVCVCVTPGTPCSHCVIKSVRQDKANQATSNGSRTRDTTLTISRELNLATVATFGVAIILPKSSLLFCLCLSLLLVCQWGCRRRRTAVHCCCYVSKGAAKRLAFWWADVRDRQACMRSNFYVRGDTSTTTTTLASEGRHTHTHTHILEQLWPWPTLQPASRCVMWCYSYSVRGIHWHWNTLAIERRKWCLHLLCRRERQERQELLFSPRRITGKEKSKWASIFCRGSVLLLSHQKTVA